MPHQKLLNSFLKNLDLDLGPFYLKKELEGHLDAINLMHSEAASKFVEIISKETKLKQKSLQY